MNTVSSKIAFIQSVFGSGEVRRENITVHCPICNDSRSEKKKLSIRLTDDINHCWVCGWSARSLLPLLRKFAPEKIEEYKLVNPFLGTKILVENFHIPLSLPSDFKLLAITNGDPYANNMKDYLYSRGIGIREMWRWKIGFSRNEHWVNRVIIPSYDRNGDINFYTGRTIIDQPFRKYENCDVKRSEIVFDEMNIDWKKELVLVEGPFDLIKCNMNATCLLGSSISEDSLLHEKILLHNTPVVIMMDNDMYDKAIFLAQRFISYGITVKCVFLEEKDPGQMSIEEVEKCVKKSSILNNYDLMKIKLQRAFENPKRNLQ